MLILEISLLFAFYFCEPGQLWVEREKKEAQEGPQGWGSPHEEG